MKKDYDQDRVRNGTNIELSVLDLGECMPSKCTGRKLVQMGYARTISRMEGLRAGAIVLVPAPHSELTLSPSDRETAINHGITALDCSWNKAEGDRDGEGGTFAMLRSGLRKRRVVTRALPFLMPVNPVNYGHALKLSTLEALAAAVYIMGNKEQAGQILSIYKWAPHFLEMNKEPLEDYASAEDSKQVVELQARYF